MRALSARVLFTSIHFLLYEYFQRDVQVDGQASDNENVGDAKATEDDEEESPKKKTKEEKGAGGKKSTALRPDVLLIFLDPADKSA